MRYIMNCDPRLGIESPYESDAAPEAVYLRGEIGEETAALFRRDMEVAENNALMAGQEILPICIDSVGGSIIDALGMIDAMEACSVKLATVIEAKAMSAAAALALCGDPEYRYMGANATMMIHLASGGTMGTVEEIENDTSEIRRLWDVLLVNMAKNCSRKKNWFTQQIKENGPDWWISAKEAKALNFIKHIGIPVLETNITVNHKLKLK